MTTFKELLTNEQRQALEACRPGLRVVATMDPVIEAAKARHPSFRARVQQDKRDAVQAVLIRYATRQVGVDDLADEIAAAVAGIDLARGC